MTTAPPQPLQSKGAPTAVRRTEGPGRARFARLGSLVARSDLPGNSSASRKHGLKMATGANPRMLCIDETKERIKKMFDGGGLSVSPYDTAWVAMIPSSSSPELPHFPQCVNWLLSNQHHDGSWGLFHRNQFLLRDRISSTLACVLALKRWGVGCDEINRGLQFIELNFSHATDEMQHSPVGFDIIFPGMIERAKDLNLDLPMRSVDVNAMFCKRDFELKRTLGTSCEGRKAYLSYVSEGLGKFQDWEMAMKYQRKNGSLFNSPSATAAAVIHLQNCNCLSYLDLVLDRFGNAVPTIYPLDIFTRLCIVDSLEKLGIDRHFMKEICSVLDETHRCWQQGEEEIFLDNATCALAFRILRIHGYDVSSEPVCQFPDEDDYFDSLCSHLKDTSTLLELFRASELTYPDESTLERQRLWLSQFFKNQLLSDSIPRFDTQTRDEVNDALKFPFHANLDRLKNMRSIRNYKIGDTRMLKTSYCSSVSDNEDLLNLAVEDFNMCQSAHREELKELDRWVAESRLNELTFARKKLAYCYFSAAATLSPPNLHEARNSWAKNAVLTTVVDDFFDTGGTEEELRNLVSLVEKWDGVHVGSDCCSEQVEIIFLGLRNTINEIGDKAYAWQGRNVTSHIVQIWLDLMRSMLREAEWVRTKTLPGIDEYMENGYTSFALGPIVLPTLYFIGPKLTEEVTGSIEFHNLFKLMSTCGRLLNDIQTVEREAEEGKLNAVLLREAHGDGHGAREENVEEMRGMVEGMRKELLRMVLEGKGGVVPWACKGVFWKMSQVVHCFYASNDGFSSHELMGTVRALFQEPLVL